MPEFDERLRRALDSEQPPDLWPAISQGAPRRPGGSGEPSERRWVVIAVCLVVVVAGIGLPLKAMWPLGDKDKTYPGSQTTVVANGRIAYAEHSTNGELRLVSMTSRGANARVIPTPQGEPVFPAWSPDGTKVAVTIFPSWDPMNADRTNWKRAIWVMNADGSDPVKIASADNVSVASWSPDGTEIAFAAEATSRTSGIHIVNADGSGDRAIYEIRQTGSRAVMSAAFSPDGAKIVFAAGTASDFDIYAMDCAGPRSEIWDSNSTDTKHGVLTPPCQTRGQPALVRTPSRWRRWFASKGRSSPSEPIGRLFGRLVGTG